LRSCTPGHNRSAVNSANRSDESETVSRIGSFYRIIISSGGGGGPSVMAGCDARRRTLSRTPALQRFTIFRYVLKTSPPTVVRETLGGRRCFVLRTVVYRRSSKDASCARCQTRQLGWCYFNAQQQQQQPTDANSRARSV
jgi:hypothetical protein